MKPYFETKLGKLYCGDCLDVAKDIELCSFSFGFIDPPYNCNKKYDGYKDNLPDDVYMQWMEKVLHSLRNIARSICVYTPHKYACEYWSFLGSDFYQIILSYSPEGAIRGKNLINQYSFLLTDAIPKKYCKNVWHNCQMPGLGWFFREETYGHPGYTSEDITARAIDFFAGESVIDFFGGTGTTGLICERTNKNWLLIEQSEKYCEIAAKRIDAEARQGKMF